MVKVIDPCLFRSLSVVFPACAVTAGCSGSQSSLSPAGPSAERIAEIFWLMTAGATVIWLAVILLALWAARTPAESHTRRRSSLLIVGAGAVFPTICLTALLIYGLAPLPVLLAPAPQGSLKVAVSGEQWWWRVTYDPDGKSVVLANEIRLPLGESVEFRLESPDVIHSFWIPSLAGKMDMIPGRTTRLALKASKTGVYRGACAEYCGTSHALMSLFVVVHEREDFERWLAHQATPAAAPRNHDSARGQALFLANGCGACHTIRGTSARGILGPDLTHVGSRLGIGAAALPNGRDALVRWIQRTDHVKPGVLMPAFGMLPQEDLHAMALYLEGLE